MSRERATAADVAKRAGVSRATVSYVLNGSDTQTISARTQRAVRRAAEELDYRPNPFAQSLKRGRGGTVLFPLPDGAMNLVLAEAIDACANALSERGLTLITDSTRYKSAVDRADAWLRLHPAAVIDLFVRHDDAMLEPLRRSGVLVVTSSATDGESAAEELVLAARQAQVEYVVGRGHRMLLLAGQPAINRAVEARIRARMTDAAKRAGAQVRVHRAPLSRRGVHAVADRWAGMDPRATAICASNDEFAIALLAAFEARRVRVPDDVAVIGVDNIPLGAAMTPSLTTVAADFAPWGEAIAAIVHDAVEGTESEATLPPLTARIEVRESA
jgi:DNA-binding LacI/PurR family transcriptional regulator